MDFRLARPGSLRRGGERLVGVVPAEAFSNIRATRSGTYLREIALPGTQYGGVQAFNGQPWLTEMDPDTSSQIRFQRETALADPVAGIDMSRRIDGQIRAIARAAATAAVYMTTSPRESVQVELFFDIYTPDDDNQDIQFPIITPFVTTVRDSERAIAPDLTRPQAVSFLADEISRLLREKLSKYGRRQQWFAAIDPVIVRFQTPPRVGRGGHSIVGRSLELGSRAWVSYSPRTNSQCLFQALCIARSWARTGIKRDAQGNRVPYKFTQLFDQGPTAQALWQNSTRAFRDGLKARALAAGVEWEGDGFASFQTLKIFVDTYQAPVKVYSTALILKQTFVPDPESPLKMERLPKLPPKTDCIELMYTGDHYIVLLRRRALTAVFGEGWEKEAEAMERKPIKFLDATADGLRPYDVEVHTATKLPDAAPVLAEGEALSRPLRVPAYTQAAKYQTADDQALKMLAWDTETYVANGRCILYATGLAWFERVGDELEIRHRIWRGEDSTCDMLVWLASNSDELPLERVHDSFLIAHNASKFDNAMLCTSVALSSRHPWNIDCQSMVENNSRWISGRLYMKQNYRNFKNTEKTRRVRITLRDSCCILPGSLSKLARDLNCGGQQKLDLPHDRIFGGDPAPSKPEHLDDKCPLHWSWLWEDGWDGRRETWGVYSYLKADCVSLLQVMRKFNESIFSTFKFGALQCPTAASISKRIFLSRYYTPGDMHVCADAYEKVIRTGFLGGRVECFRQGRVEGPIYYYDFTSLYPGVGRRVLPSGAPTIVSTADWRSEAGFGYYVCDVHCNMDKILPHYLPLHPVIANSRLVFPWIAPDRPVRMCLFQPAMALAEKLMPGVYTYAIKFVILFQPKSFMTSFFEDMVAKKAEARANGQSALEAAAKIVANSGFGWTGLRWYSVDGVCLTEANDDSLYERYLAERRLLASARFGKYQVLRRRDTMKNDQTAIQVAAAISCYGRMKTFELMYDIRKSGGDVYYCDTDSVMCSYRLSDDPYMLNKYIPDHATNSPGAALESLKNELDADLAKKKLVPKNQLHDMAFTRLYLLGAKFYCLEFDRDSMQHSICKAKGYKQTSDQPLEIEKYKQMSENLDELERVFGGGSSTPKEDALRLGALANRQMQLPFSKTIMLDTHDDALVQMGWVVRHQITHRVFKPTYSKGYVEKSTRKITPFLLTTRGLEGGDDDEVMTIKDLVNN